MVVAVVCSGCSLLFVERVEDGWKPTTEPRCTSSAGPFVLDMLAVTGNGLTAAVAYRNGQQIADQPGTEGEVARYNTIIALGALGAAVYIASALYGVMQTGKCDEARAERDGFIDWQRRRPPPAPAPVPAPAAPPARVDPVTPPAPPVSAPPPAPVDAGVPPS